jgi:hypothetical protein
MEMLDDEMVAGLEGLGCPIGDAALKEAGIQAEFAAHLALHFSHFGAGITLRVGTTPSYDAKRVAKPGAVLSKTSNHGLVKGLIPEIPQLTKIDKNRKPIGHHQYDKDKLKSETQSTIPLSLSLREILESAGKEGDMSIAFDKAKNRLVLQYRQGKGPIGFSGKFYVNLGEGKKIKRQYSRPWNEPKKDLVKKNNFLNVKKPDGLDKATFNQCLNLINDDFTIHYKSATSEKIKPLRVFSAKSPDTNEQLPITGDWDFLVLGHPPTGLPDYAYEVLHTFPRKTNIPIEAEIARTEASDNRKQLEDRTRELFEHLKQTALAKEPGQLDLFDQYLSSVKFDAILSKKALNSAGSITPFEFLQVLMLNHAYQRKNISIYGEKGETDLSFDANIINLIQHGAENRSPYKPSDLDGKMLHFYQGASILTRNENELIKFYLLSDYLKNTRIDVHPGWAMDKWAPVIEKQQQLGQPIPSETLAVYTAYQYMQKALKTRYLPTSDLKLLAAIQCAEKNYQLIPERLRKWHAQNNSIQQLPNPMLWSFAEGKNAIDDPRKKSTSIRQRETPRK